jgi:hypothetical protein
VRRLYALLLCLLALFLPWRLRVGFANLLGWSAQGLYWLYAALMRVMIRNLAPKEPPRP